MSDYIEMLIAAGWVEGGAVDDDYQEYLRNSQAHPMDRHDYDTWRALWAEWRNYNAQFEALEQKYGVGTVFDVAEIQSEIDTILAGMTHCEFELEV